MCGIAGFVSFGGPPYGHPEAEVVDRMCRVISHRGPDAQGTWLGPRVAFGARRLAIVDVAGSHQPAVGASGRTRVVFNGEIYNFGEVRREIEGRGYSFRTQGDTEVLAHGYEAFGMPGLLERIDGMFALALHDERDGSTWFARDRLGKKPLHLSRRGGTLLFGSETKSLLQHPAFEREVDPHALTAFLSLDWIPGDRHVYRGVERVAPASWIRFGPDGARSSGRAWCLRWDQAGRGRAAVRAGGVDAWVEGLREEVRGAVERRLVSEVPLGALLSGGVDSSATAALVAQHRPGVKTFSVAFDSSSFDESPWARRVAAHIGSEHHESIFDLAACQRALDALPAWLDEPFADASILPTWHLSRTVREHGVTVVLSGDGADEAFAGYPTYLAHALASGLERVPMAVRRLLTRLVEHAPSSYGDISFDFKARRLLLGLAQQGGARHGVFLGGFDPQALRAVLHADHRGLPDHRDPYEPLITALTRSMAPTPVERWLDVDLQNYLVDDILVKVDRASMASSVEVRCPLLDSRVVDYAAATPAEWKLRGFDGKWLWKRAAAPWLPPGLTGRPKKGFGMPVALWLKGPLRPWMEDLLRSPSRGGWFDQAEVARLLDDHVTGRLDQRKRLWPLLMWRLWEEGPFGPPA